MPNLLFKNISSIKSLSAGDTLSKDSGLGGCYSYNVIERQNEGLLLKNKSNEQIQFSDWGMIKDDYFINASTPMFKVNKKQFMDIFKAGYSIEDTSTLLRCTEATVARGLNEIVPINEVIDKNGRTRYFENKYDALFISKQLGVLPPKENTISMEQYLTSTVHQSIAEFLIFNTALEIMSDYPECSVDQHRRLLKSSLETTLPMTNKELSLIYDTPIGYGAKGLLGEVFSRVLDKQKISAPLRAKEILNHPSTYNKAAIYTTYENDTQIMLPVQGNLEPFVHQEVNNQLFILHHPELGTTSPDLTKDLACMVESALLTVKNIRNNLSVQSVKENTVSRPKR